jgi:4-carboxymuconolactone decarboxylase
MANKGHDLYRFASSHFEIAMPAKTRSPRLKDISEAQMTARQHELAAEMMKSRGKSAIGGPFGVFLHAPDYGDHAQKLGAHCRYRTAVPPRLSEFAILAIARLWRAQYEWHVHAPIAEKAGVGPKTIKDLRAGRAPKSAPKDERAIYDFISQLHKAKRVSDKAYARVHALLGDAGMVEFAGILGYYTLIAMTLNVFRVPLPDGEALPFAESAARR